MRCLQPFTWCLLVALVGCQSGDKEEDSSASVDTAADTAADANAGPTPGALLLTLRIDTGSSELSGDCIGTMNGADVDAAIDGTGSCTMGGDLTSWGSLSSTLQGTISDLSASGVYEVVLYEQLVSIPWTGSVTDDQVEGTLSGTDSVELPTLDTSVPVYFDGTFDYGR